VPDMGRMKFKARRHGLLIMGCARDPRALRISGNSAPAKCNLIYRKNVSFAPRWNGALYKEQLND
jgi:hypothetical protein